eukprot:522183-Hanusia_phi.AAC.2
MRGMNLSDEETYLITYDAIMIHEQTTPASQTSSACLHSARVHSIAKGLCPFDTIQKWRFLPINPLRPLTVYNLIIVRHDLFYNLVRAWSCGRVDQYKAAVSCLQPGDLIVEEKTLIKLIAVRLQRVLLGATVGNIKPCRTLQGSGWVPLNPERDLNDGNIGFSDELGSRNLFRKLQSEGIEGYLAGLRDSLIFPQFDAIDPIKLDYHFLRGKKYVPDRQDLMHQEDSFRDVYSDLIAKLHDGKIEWSSLHRFLSN